MQIARPDVRKGFSLFRKPISDILLTGIPRQTPAVLSVLDRLFRTAADARHTVRAVFPPHRLPLLDAHIAERADGRAFPQEMQLSVT